MTLNAIGWYLLVYLVIGTIVATIYAHNNNLVDHNGWPMSGEAWVVLLSMISIWPVYAPPYLLWLLMKIDNTTVWVASPVIFTSAWGLSIYAVDEDIDIRDYLAIWEPDGWFTIVLDCSDPRLHREPFILASRRQHHHRFIGG